MNSAVRELLSAGKSVAAELSQFGGYRRWIVVFPFQIHPETGMPTINHTNGQWQFRVRCFGLPTDFDFLNYDVHEEDFTNYENRVVDNMDSVKGLISKWVTEDTILREAHEVGCPL